MTSTLRRAPEEVLDGFGAWLRHRDPSVGPRGGGPRAAHGGVLDRDHPGRRASNGAQVERLVLKLPPAGPAIFPTYDFDAQARVQEAVAAVGIPAPRAGGGRTRPPLAGHLLPGDAGHRRPHHRRAPPAGPLADPGRARPERHRPRPLRRPRGRHQPHRLAGRGTGRGGGPARQRGRARALASVPGLVRRGRGTGGGAGRSARLVRRLTGRRRSRRPRCCGETCGSAT